MKARFIALILCCICTMFISCEKDYDFQNSQQPDTQEVGVEVYNQKQEVSENAATISCQITSIVSISKVYLEYWMSADEQNKLIMEMKTSDKNQPYTYTVLLKDLQSGTEYQTAYKIISEKNQTIRISGKSFRTASPQTMTFSYPEGAVHGAIMVSDKKYVAFSIGNLRYNADTKIWRFAGMQYAIVGEANKNVSATYNRDIDLFMFGTSGYDSYYPPYYSSSSGYYRDITNTEYDWGIYNKISNGGNQVGLWRTLSQEEWEYLLAHNIVAKAQIESTKGVIILPVGFQYPDGIGAIIPDATYSKNFFNETNWGKMETNGAVFLPIAGCRSTSNKDEIYWTKDNGHYWSTTSGISENWALGITDKGIFVSQYFNDEYHGYDSEKNSHFAFSVRLVCDLN